MKTLFKTATLFVASISILFSMGSCSSTKPLDKAQLSGYWVLKTLDGTDAKTAFEGPMPSIEFNFESNQINGSAGCNRYFGSFTLSEKNEFAANKLGSTLMACAHKNDESKFLETLETPATLIIDKDGVLNFNKGNKTLLQFKKGEDLTSAEPVTVDQLIGNWTLKSIADGDMKTLFGERPATIKFAADNTVNGYGGCNQYRGTYTLDNNTISFGPLASTRMACPNEGENKYLPILSLPVQVKIDGETLSFVQNGSVVLEFSKTVAAE